MDRNNSSRTALVSTFVFTCIRGTHRLYRARLRQRASVELIGGVPAANSSSSLGILSYEPSTSRTTKNVQRTSCATFHPHVARISLNSESCQALPHPAAPGV